MLLVAAGCTNSCTGLSVAKQKVPILEVRHAVLEDILRGVKNSEIAPSTLSKVIKNAESRGLLDDGVVCVDTTEL